jgi:predicted phage-related endonuclease
MKPIATELKVEQGSEEWLEARLGLCTASRFKDVIAKIAKGESAQRRNYKAEVMLEAITHRTPERFKSTAMQWGNDTEELAATRYMSKTGNIAETCGIFIHNDYKIGDSPDRLVSKDGCVEIKCFNSANHFQALKNNKMPPEHKPQVQGHMWLTSRQWCDFVSFDPDFPKHAQIFIERIYREETYIEMLKAEVLQFLSEVEKDIEFLNSYNQKEPAHAVST